MAITQPRLRSLFLAGVGLGVLMLGGLWLRDRIGPGRGAPPTAAPTTGPAMSPGMHSAGMAIAPPRSYIDVIRRAYPSFSLTQLLDERLSLQYAGHFVLPEAVYLDGTGRLWMTRADAEETDAVLAQASEQQVILTTQRPAFVHWVFDGNGEMPSLVCLNDAGDGYELISTAGRQPIGRGIAYDWRRARSWGERIVVPTEVGVSVFSLKRRVSESASPLLAKPGEAHAPVQFTFGHGPLAWIPPQPGHPGSQGAVRYVEEDAAWVELTPEKGWPAGLVHLIPLLDGSVLQLLGGAEEAIKTRILSLDPMSDEDRNRIASLISQLSDSNAARRDRAYQELTRYGSGLEAVAEQLMAGESPETRARLNDLLKARVRPLLGGMQLVDGKMRVVTRYPDGGVLFYTERGVLIPRGNGETQTVAPAWLSALPGDSIRLLSPELVQDLEPDKVRLTRHFGEWIVTDPVLGPQRFLGGDLVPLLRKSEREFSQFVGISRGNRYVFSRRAAWTTTQPQASAEMAGLTLIIDPRLPDPAPRLPVWPIEYPSTATVGWDKNDWPAAKQRSGWALGAKEWRVLDEADDPFFSSPDQIPPWPPLPSTHPARADAEVFPIPADEKPILVDAEGTYYFDGRAALVVARRDGTVVRWPLPSQAQGDGDVHLVRTGDGRLFLFNQPGRVLRIRPLSDGAEPFVLEATFTRKIPDTEHPSRIWLDPFGRINIAYEGNKLAILFPQGYIPPEVLSLVPIEDQDLWLEE